MFVKVMKKDGFQPSFQVLKMTNYCKSFEMPKILNYIGFLLHTHSSPL